MNISRYSDLKVYQSGNIVEAYIPQGIKVLSINLPYDGQAIEDATLLDGICKILAGRWGVSTKKKKSNSNKKSNTTGKNLGNLNYGGLRFRQAGQSLYEIYLPNGVLVTYIQFPPDKQYCKDAVCLSYVCRGIAKRYRIA